MTTYSATKTYDGTALTASGELAGFVNNESATLVITGSQTEVGTSDNTYWIDWNGTAKQANYTIASETIGKLTVTAAPVPPGPTPGPTPGPDPTPTPGGGTPATTINDAQTPLASESIADGTTPLAAFDDTVCWVHWWIMLGIAMTAVYGLALAVRRRGFTIKLSGLDDQIMGVDKGSAKTPVARPGRTAQTI